MKWLIEISRNQGWPETWKNRGKQYATSDTRHDSGFLNSIREKHCKDIRCTKIVSAIIDLNRLDLFDKEGPHDVRGILTWSNIWWSHINWKHNVTLVPLALTSLFKCSCHIQIEVFVMEECPQELNFKEEHSIKKKISTFLLTAEQSYSSPLEQLIFLDFSPTYPERSDKKFYCSVRVRNAEFWYI